VNHSPSPVRRISAKKRSVKTADSCSVVRALQFKEIVLDSRQEKKALRPCGDCCVHTNHVGPHEAPQKN
jgi:hypothetical protein